MVRAQWTSAAFRAGTVAGVVALLVLKIGLWLAGDTPMEASNGPLVLVFLVLPFFCGAMSVALLGTRIRRTFGEGACAALWGMAVCYVLLCAVDFAGGPVALTLQLVLSLVIMFGVIVVCCGIPAFLGAGLATGVRNAIHDRRFRA